MENIWILQFIIAIAIYFLSIPVARWSNKYAFLKAGYAVIPSMWFVPGINTLVFFFLVLSTWSELLFAKIKPAKYYERKWKSKNKVEVFDRNVMVR